MGSSGGNRTHFSLQRTGKTYQVYEWTPLQDEYLRREWIAGTPPKVIAGRLQRTVKSIHGRVQRRGFKRKHSTGASQYG